MRRIVLSILMVLTIGAPATATSTAIIDTVVGGGSPNMVAATTANLSYPTAVVLGPGGDLFLADNGHNRVYRIDPTGLLIAVAGTGAPGFGGDGGPALQALLLAPRALAFDPHGNLFVSMERRVRRIDALTGVITTVAGSGARDDTGDGGPATQAGLRQPYDLACDAAGNLFILDEESRCVRRVDAATGIISTYAGGGLNSGDGLPATLTYFGYPRAIAFDAGGNLLIAEYARVRRVDRTTGLVSTVAGSGITGFLGDGGPALAARLDYPEGLDVDGAGNLLIADQGNHRVRRVDRLTGVITTIAGSGDPGFSGDGGPATAGGVDPWEVVAGAGGDLYIADSANYRIRKVQGTSGLIGTIAGNGSRCCFYREGFPAHDVELETPFDVAVDGEGNVFILDVGTVVVRRLDRKTGLVTTVAGNGTVGYSGDGGPATAASLNVRSFEGGIASDAAGNLFIADSRNNRVRRVDAASGIIETVAGNGSRTFNGDGIPATSAGIYPVAVAVGSNGDVFLIDTASARVRRVEASTGLISTVAGNGIGAYSGDGMPAVESSLYFPWDIALDSGGNLLIAEGGFNDEMDPIGSNRIRRVDAVTGILTTVAGRGGFYSGPNGVPATSSGLFLPWSVTVDGADNFYFSELVDLEEGAFRGGVRGVSAATGIVDRVTGPRDAYTSCDSDDIGDGGPAVEACVSGAFGLATDSSGNLYIADLGTRRVRRVLLGNGPPVARAGADLTVECDSATGAHVTLDGSASSDLDSTPGTDDDIASWEWFEAYGQPGAALLGTGRTLETFLSPGGHTVTLKVTDRAGASAIDAVTVTVAQGPPDGLSLALSPGLLWPPNHRMVTVTAAPSSSNACVAVPLYTLLAVTSSEPDDAPGGSDGNTSGDIDASIGASDLSFNLRAERDAQGSGRFYQVTYLASNAAGQATVTAGIAVPHDIGGVIDPVELTVGQTPAGTLLEWGAVAGASRYNVIGGVLADFHVVGNGVDVRHAECLAPGLANAGTALSEDPAVPEPGRVRFYLVEYDDGMPSGFGAPDAQLPLLVPGGVCP